MRMAHFDLNIISCNGRARSGELISSNLFYKRSFSRSNSYLTLLFFECTRPCYCDKIPITVGVIATSESHVYKKLTIDVDVPSCHLGENKRINWIAEIKFDHQKSEKKSEKKTKKKQNNRLIFEASITSQTPECSFYITRYFDNSKLISLGNGSWSTSKATNWEVINHFFDFFDIVLEGIKPFAQWIILQIQKTEST